MLVTYRSDELDRRHPLAPLLQTWRRSRVAELVTLSPLGETEIAEMIAAILDHDEIGPEFRDLMHARTEGNPFVLEAAATSPSSARPRTSPRALQAAAEAGEIVLSEEAHRRVAQWLEERGLEAVPQTLELKGFDEPQPAFRLKRA